MLPTNDGRYFGWVVSILDNAGIELLEVFCLVSGVYEGCPIGQVQLFQRNPGPLGIWASECKAEFGETQLIAACMPFINLYYKSDVELLPIGRCSGFTPNQHTHMPGDGRIS